MPHLKTILPGCCAALLCASLAPSQQFVDTRGTMHLARIDAAQFVAIPNGSGLAELDLPMPNVPALVGVAVHFQALQAGPAGLALTNLASTTIE